VAYSGGPDSTALLLALSSLGWRSILAIHVDHGLRPRPELDAELAVVKANCAELGAGLVVAHVRPGAIEGRAKESGLGTEAEARKFRYAALRRAASAAGARAVLLAHNLDDQVETVLMRILAGSGAGGIRGMPEASGPFLRPLLGIAKPRLLDYLRDRGRAYSIDSTNASDSYLRNRIRHDLVPFLDARFPGWRRGLARAQDKAALDEEALGALSRGLFRAEPDGSLRCGAASLASAPEAVAIRAVVAAAGTAVGEDRVSSSMAREALKALGAGGYRGRGIDLRREGEDVVLRRAKAVIGRGGLDFPLHDGYFVIVDRPSWIRVGRLLVIAVWDDSPGADAGIREGAFSFPLVVRSRRPGDALALRRGSKRLDELLAEWGIPACSRDKVPIIEDRDGIVAVLGAGAGGRDRYRASRAGYRLGDGAEGRRFSVIVKGA